jgi:thiol-disulfide isomerase/thioredoxin
VRAPELVGRGWLNTGKEITLAELRGKIVLLDFWTFCCINCLHVLDELRPLEDEYADVLVTIGVHSPKFAHEAEPAAVSAAVRRHDVHHPVLDDPELTTWQQYAVKAWPTLVLVDPDGYVAHVAAGEGHADALRAVIDELIAEHEAKGTLRRGDGPDVPPASPESTLRFPAKVVLTPAATLLVADTAAHRIVEFDADGDTVLRVIGSGRRGVSDGGLEVAEFSEPSGLALLPEKIARQVGYHVVVADTVNHLLRGIDLDTGAVRTVAGTGAQWRTGPTSGQASAIALCSPWDVTWWEPAGGIVIAMAGNHTLGVFDPLRDKVSRFAGSTVEGLRDGVAADAFFAQPSGLAAAGDRLWLVDAETSALRWLDHDLTVHTAIGKGLFDFGHRDGPADQALLQHPLGVTVLGDGAIAVSDTYNGAIRRYDPETGQVSTMAIGISEPSGAAVVGDRLVVVASAAHRLEWLDGIEPGDQVVGDAKQVRRPPTDIVPGEVELAVVFTPPAGQKLDDSHGPSTRLEVTSSPPELLIEGAGTGTELTRRLVVSGDIAEGVLHVVAQIASCDDNESIVHPACHMTRQDWGVPVRATSAGLPRLALVMGGLDE